MTAPGPLVVVGDALLDRDVDGQASRLVPDAPVPVLDDTAHTLRPGGAALAALLAAQDGTEVTLVAPLGDDPASAAVGELLGSAVTVVPLPLCGPLPEKTRFRAAGRTLLRVDPPAGSPGPAAGSAAAARAIAAAGALLVSDYGRGVTRDRWLRDRLTARAAHAPLLWDPHPRGAAPVPGTRVATPNHGEAAAAAGLAAHRRDQPLDAALAAAHRLVRRWPVDAVAVTLGSRGALLAHRGSPTPLIVPARQVNIQDACGAGDRFAAAAAAALCGGALTSEAVAAATAAATGFLASGGVASLRPAGCGTARPARPGVAAGADAARLASDVRAAGGTVIATGGCFDVLHAGHVSMLQAARSLGDCLIVCLNSDASVRRLKGPRRPVNPGGDRAAVLAALECVDCVTIFEEDTPAETLRRLRPHVWVKGGDYSNQDLPEAAVLGGWGGHAVTVPYLAGRSTTRLQAAAAAAPGAAGR